MPLDEKRNVATGAHERNGTSGTWQRCRSHRHVLYSVIGVGMEGLNRFESAVLAKLLAGDHPVLTALRLQADTARLAAREYTGAGFYCTFDVPSDVAPLTHPLDFHFGDVDAKISGLKHGAGFVVFVRSGRLDLLEGYSYDEPWPETISDFELSYQSEPRNPSLPSV